MAKDGAEQGYRWEHRPEGAGKHQGSTLAWDVPGLGVGTVQHHGEKPLGVPPALLAPGNLEHRGSVHPGFGTQPQPCLGWCWSGRSPVCHSRAKGFTEEIPGELNVRLLLTSSSASGRAPLHLSLLGGSAGWGHRDPLRVGMEPRQGTGRADNPWLPFPSRGSCR